jgi:hypothetical protein
MKTNENYTLITGASMGLGKEMAIAFARKGRNLVLVALPGQNLSQLCGEISLAFGVKTVAKECDLTDETALFKLADDILTNYSIDQLINNAGVGGTAAFETSSIEYLERIINLNVRATTLLTRLILPSLKEQKKALIINVSSLAAFGPLPYKTIYPASKAFIYSFSRGLNRELRGTGVKVIVVAPGPFASNPDVTRRIMKQSFVARLGVLSSREITLRILSGADRGQNVIVPGIMNRLNQFLMRFTPESLRLSLMEKVIKRELVIGKA